MEGMTVADADLKNLTWHQGAVRHEDRERLLRQRGCVVWLTGLSGSGKSTVAHGLEERLVQAGHLAYVLDGDNIRHGLNADLGFTPADRTENIRRVGQVAGLFADAGVIAIAAFISPYREDRAQARRICGERVPFVEVFLDVPLAVCEQRDPKKLYRKARSGEISGFTGIDAPYEEPVAAELSVATHLLSVAGCVDKICYFLVRQGILRTDCQSGTNLPSVVN